jgi:hypothetical protein
MRRWILRFGSVLVGSVLCVGVAAQTAPAKAVAPARASSPRMGAVVPAWLQMEALLRKEWATRHLSESIAKDDANDFAANRCVSKGGIGALGEKLYVDLKADRNELRLRGGNRWRGKAVPTTELVFFFENRVWARQSLPPSFDLSRAVVVSFEGQRVRFFDFGKMRGCYYDRFSAVSRN